MWRVLLTALLLTCSPAGLAQPDTRFDEVPETLIFGSDTDYPPFEWREDGKARGFNVALARALGQLGERTVKHRSGSWPDIVDGLRAGSIDVVPMLRTPDRQREFHFSDPFYFAQTGIYGPADAPSVSRLVDLTGRAIAVEAQSHTAGRLRESRLAISLHQTTNTLTTLQEVSSEEVDYAVVNTVVADRLIARRGFELEQKGPPLWSHGYAFAVRNDRPQLAQWIDHNFATLVTSGRFSEIQSHWADQLAPDPFGWHDILVPAALIGGPVLAFVAAAVAWNRMLSRKVAAHTIALTRELERRREAEESVRYHATHEPITGLPRRNQFIDDAEDALAHAPAGQARDVLVFHINNIGNIVRVFGHATGEEAMRAFAERLRQSGLDVVGGFGGHTFGAVAIGSDSRQLIEALSRTVVVGSVDFDPVVVAGIAREWDEHIGAAELLRRAETALARASGARSTLVVYDRSMEPDPDDLELVSSFRRTGGDEIHAAFQPQIRLADGVCVGCEALVRWNHPALGAISPSRFVPLLEDAGIIETLTSRMIERSLELTQDLHAAGVECPVSVNLSMSDLMESEFIGALEQALARHGGRPADLKIEITETSFADNFEGLSQRLEELRVRGVRSSIDDFGTGYASLAYLSQFAVDEVKIDRMFVTDMLNNSRHRAIVRATIQLAKDLGLTVVAEGAEDSETVAALAEDGCDHVQGFVLAMPLDAEEFVSFARARMAH
jgi:EAL domain-containing protein (putative c-di-GMP-specific phosphodiesterase class I)/ABC-type amino acid transport substrate-binding protein/GGDEF domain-containing protein